MADYRTHVTTSTLLGLGFGAGMTYLGALTPVEGALAACLTGVAGMLPDLDSESGRPVREVFGLVAAMAPMVLLRRLMMWSHGDFESACLLAVLIYVSIRYGAGLVLGMAAVHRGMFHSIPALIIASEVTYLGYHHPLQRVRVLMGLGVGIGFASHLILDEIYSVQLNGMAVHLKASAGSAVKFFGKSWRANIFAYALLMTVTYMAGVNSGLIRPDATGMPRGPQASDDPASRRG